MVVMSISILFNYDNIAHPSEHNGNRFHAISPIPNEDLRLCDVASSSGSGCFEVHNDATAYNNFDTEAEFIDTLNKLNTDLDTVSKKLKIR